MPAAQIDPREAVIRAIEGQGAIGGRYTSVCRLGQNAGEGRFSLVFSAEDSTTGEMVCLKVHSPLEADPYRGECFSRECCTLYELRGQADILPIVETENSFALQLQAGENPVPFPLRYFSTALARSDVHEYIYSARANPLKSLECFRAICRGLQRLAVRRICHRDLKPTNCLIGPGKEIWVGDFGTARILDGSQPALRQDYGLSWRGDVRYTAPELLCGLEDEDLFFAGDFFSLGAILFEMFTQTVLTNYIYGPAFIADLRQAFSLIDPDKRDEMFSGIVTSIAAARPLPSLRQVPNTVPKSILDRVDGLYHRLARLDYRRRLHSFPEIFRELSGCERILAHEAKYQALLRQRETWKKRRQEGAQMKELRQERC